MSVSHTLRSRLRYRFDAMLARGTTAVILWMFLITFAVVVVTGTILSVTEIAVHGHQVGIVEGIWQNLLRSFEPAAMEADTGWPLRIQSLIVVLFGILVGSSLIGLIASGVDRRVTELRKGRSLVLEEGHTLVLGWSEKVFTIVAELVAANRGRKNSCIVLLAPHDRVEMEDEIRARVPDAGRTRIVCRSGDPSVAADLALASPYESSAVIVLGTSHADGDAQVIRTVLALMEDDRFANLRVVADCLYEQNASALRDATEGRAITIASSEIISRITAQACRHTGLGSVFQELLDTDDINLYFHSGEHLVGMRFGDVVLRYKQGVPIGIRYAAGSVELNPPDDYVLVAGDSVVMVADADDSLALSEAATHAPAAGRHVEVAAPTPSHILFIGWNSLAPRVITELDNWVVKGSILRVLLDASLIDPESLEFPELSNIEVAVSTTGSSAPRVLTELMATERYERIVVLCYRDQLSNEEADARTLMTLLQLKQLRRLHPDLTDRVAIVAEVLDTRDVELARAGGADDFIVSDRLTALMLSQLAELPDREKIFADLFEARGSQICMRPVSDYADLDQQVLYGAYAAAAQARGDLAIGYRTSHRNGNGHGNGNGNGFEIVLNPKKSTPVEFGDDDRLIVVMRR